MKKLYTLSLALCICIFAVAQPVLSPAMRSRVKKAQSAEKIEAFITADDAAIATLRSNGVKVDARVGDMAVITGSRDELVRAAVLSGVSSIELPGRVYLHTDSSRSNTHVNELLSGTGLPMPYDGNGVVLGMVDCGYDYQHMAFKDANGNSRITRVYHPVEAGDGVSINGCSLPGRDYTTPEEIATLTTDDKTMNHACHTSGIAGGTRVGKYSGMAPNAELVMVGIPSSDLSITNVVYGVLYIANYAASIGRRCVINMSLGSHDGPHDGTGPLQSYMKQLNEQYGTIFVLSSGNEGNSKLYMHKQFTSTDKTLSTVMKVMSNKSNIQIWSRTAAPLSISYAWCDSYNNKIMASTGPIACDSILNLGSLPDFKSSFSGEITISQGLRSNGKYGIEVSHNTSPTASGYYLAFSVHGDEGTEVDVWDADENAYFSNMGFAGYSSGTPEGSYSDMATGDYCISVGASAARDSYPTNYSTSYNGYDVGDVASFSSYGTDPTGAVHPFVLAPGVSVVSSISGYNGSKSTYSQRKADSDGKYHYWYVKSGTSMSAPCVSGIIALWLQACPNATLSQIKDAIVETAYHNPDGNPKRGDNGIIDALGGVRYLLEHCSVLPGDVNGDGEVDIADVNILVNIILGHDEASKYDGRADVNNDSVIDIADVNEVLNLILNN